MIVNAWPLDLHVSKFTASPVFLNRKNREDNVARCEGARLAHPGFLQEHSGSPRVKEFYDVVSGATGRRYFLSS